MKELTEGRRNGKDERRGKGGISRLKIYRYALPRETVKTHMREIRTLSKWRRTERKKGRERFRRKHLTFQGRF